MQCPTLPDLAPELNTRTAPVVPRSPSRRGRRDTGTGHVIDFMVGRSMRMLAPAQQRADHRGMSDQLTGAPTPVALDTVSATIAATGWRFQADVLTTTVAVGSFTEACRVAEIAAGACDGDVEGLLRADLRADAAHLTVAMRVPMTVTQLEIDLVGRVSGALEAVGLRCGAAPAAAGRPARAPVLELAVDALDIPAVRPFWKAVLGYVDKHAGEQPGQALIDPAGRLPGLWFQQMDAPRTQRNRIHLDVWVAHDDAVARLGEVLAAGGVLVNERYAPAFWTVADVEGNEACLCTWMPAEEPSGR
jgi:4a-hydroxytetrahydrobiopterin dehydratase